MDNRNRYNNNKTPSDVNRKSVPRSAQQPTKSAQAKNMRSAQPNRSARSAKSTNPVRSSRAVPEKTVQGNTARARRKKFRGGNYVLYYILGLIVIIVVLIILANTVLFNCSSIEVTGADKYTSDEIVRSSGLQLGENLLHIDVAAARDNIINSMAYIDDAEVRKSFPTKISVTVTEAEKRFCIVENGITAAISGKGKILEYCEPGGLPIVRGFEPETTEIGRWLVSLNEGKTEIPAAILENADKAGLKDITEIDISDKFSVKVTVEDRVILSLGPAEELEQKFRVAVEIIENQLGKDEYVTLLLTNPEKVPVQNNSKPQQTQPETSAPTSEPAPSEAESVPDEGASSGAPVTD